MKKSKQRIQRTLITGASGNVGEELIKLLCDKYLSDNSSLVLAVRDIEKSRRRFSDSFDFDTKKLENGNHIRFQEFDFTNPETYDGALHGINKIFLVRPPAISDVQKYIFPFIDRARKNGVEHIVFLSLLGVEKNPVVPHYKIENYIKDSGVDYTFLRASFFMQNLNTTHRKDIMESDEVFVPAGKGKTSFIDVRDIAEVGAIALVKEGHLNKAYSLTGKEALDYFQVAEIFTQILNRDITYTKPSIFRFFFRMHKRGMKSTYILVMIALYTTARLGLAKRITSELEELLGREPISMDKYVRDYKECWN